MNNIPTITKNLLIINVAVFVATYLFRSFGVDLNNVLGLHFFLAPDFHIYQLFTYMFAHGGFSHIFFNMFALWMFGCIVERTWGPKKFLFYYIVCGVGAGLFQELAQYAQFYLLASENMSNFSIGKTMLVANANASFLNMWTTVGASGAVYGILLALSRGAHLHLPAACAYQGKVVRCGLCCDRTVHGFLYDGRRSGSSGSLGRHGVRLLPHTLLATPSRHSLQPSQRTAVLRLDACLVGAPHRTQGQRTRAWRRQCRQTRERLGLQRSPQG